MSEAAISAVNPAPATTPVLSAAGRVPIWTRTGFAAGDFAFNLYWSGTSLFLLYFYTDVLGIAPVMAGLIYFTALFWDAVLDPVMGVIADRTRSRFGRYRPYVLFGAVPLAITGVLAYAKPGLTGSALVGWALFTHCLLRTAYTVVNIPYSALMARLTPDANERAGLAGWRMAGAATGALTVAFLTPLAVKALGRGDEARGYFLAACIVGVIATAVLVFCFFAMREPAEAEGAEQAPFRLSDLLVFPRLLKTNGPLVRVFLTIVAVSIALSMFGKNTLYYFKYALKAPQWAPLALGLPGLALILCVPFWVWYARRTSKRAAWYLGSVIAGAGYLAFFLNPVPSLPVVIALTAVIAAGGSAFAVMFWSMLPDTVEYGQAKTGERNEAAVFGFASFAQKTAVGVNALLVGLMLKGVGYTPNQAQSPETLQAIRAMMTLIPLAGVLVCAVVLWGYRLDDAEHRRLRAEIARPAAR